MQALAEIYGCDKIVGRSEESMSSSVVEYNPKYVGQYHPSLQSSKERTSKSSRSGLKMVLLGLLI